MHTSAGLILCENSDPTVRTDMTNFFNKIAPKDAKYEHSDEGPDDMPAHIKSALTGTSLNIPISKGQLLMGTWQGIWLMEYRTNKHSRQVAVTITGQKSSKP
jgi:secondary thiamine-phosphate synthase enzyme